MENKIIAFENRHIRREWYEGEWYFSVVDIISALTDSLNPNRYWTDLKRRSEKETGQSYAFCVQLKMKSTDGKSYKTDCANTEGVIRIIMAIPSPKAEPFRMWLATVGKEHLDEIENPELGFERLREIYKAKGYTEEWIERRIQTIDTRKQLTNEWKGRGVKEGQEFSILTAVIAKGTFGLTPTEHKDYKGLDKPNQNLRDHMTPLELIFTALGEETTRMIAEKDNAQGFNENMESAQEGGSMAGKYRQQLEERTGAKIVSKENYLNQIDTNMDIPKIDGEGEE